MDQFLGLTIIGLSTAAIYAIGASGLVLTYTTTGVFNFAHGAIGMFGAFAYWQLRFDWGWPAPLALLAVLAVLAPALGVVLEVAVMRRLQGVAESTKLVVTISLLAAIIGLANWIWKPAVSRPMRTFFKGERFDLGPTNVTYHEAITIALAIAVAVGLRLLLFHTRAGVAMRAAVDDRPLAQMNGARPDRSAILAWAIGSSLAALSGIMIAPALALSVPILSLLIVNAYAAAMIGRLRSLPFTFIGAGIIGLAEAYLSGYLPSNPYLGGLRPAIPMIILFIVLIVLPDPRLRAAGVTRSREWHPSPSWRGTAIFAGAVLGATLLIAPLISRADSITAAKVFGLGIIVLSLVPLVGLAGQISLCQLSFAGIGAITMAHLGGGGNVFGLVAATLLTGAVGALIALPALRLSGIYLALATASFAVLLDRWIFGLPDFEVFGLFRVSIFHLGSLEVDRVELLGVSTDTPRAQLILLATVFTLLCMVVVALRRSRFGQCLLAMKGSEAACATLGMNLTLTKLAVFSISAAMAGLGGALYGGLVVSVSPESFAFVNGLPILLLGVVGGIGSIGGALFGAVALGALPVIGSTLSVLRNPMLVTPGLMGIGLGRDPNGVVSQLREGFGAIPRSRTATGVLAASLPAYLLLAYTDMINGWTFTVLVAISVVAAAAIAGPESGARRPLQPPSPDPNGVLDQIEWAGVDQPFTPAQVEALDRTLANHGGRR